MSEVEPTPSGGHQGRLDRLFRGRIDGVGNRKKAFTLPFGLLNRRKRTSPNEVEDANGNRRRAATDYSKQQRERLEQQRQQYGNGNGTPFDGSRQPSTPSTPAATVTPKPLRLLLPASSREGIRGVVNLSEARNAQPPLSAPPAPRRHAESTHEEQPNSLDVNRTRRPSFTLAARGGTLMISGDAPTAASSPDPIAHHDTPSPGSTSRSSPPSVRTRATTIQGATPILPSQRGIHGSTSAEALAAATGDQPYTLQRVRRTFSDAFRQTRARQVALERISAASTVEEDREGEGEHEDAEATLVRQNHRPIPPPANSLPWTNAMLSAHHHLTPVGEDPRRESAGGGGGILPSMSTGLPSPEQEVLSPQRGEYTHPPLSASKQDSTTYSADVTAVDTTHVPAADVAPGPEPPSRKSSLSKLKAELVQSFLANAQKPNRKRDEVDTPFTPVYMSREKTSSAKGEDSTAPQQSPTTSSHTHGHAPSYAHSSYHSHFSPTSTQQALYASKQRLIGPLEAQLAALDSQFNSIFHMLEVRRLEEQYSELQRRIEEKRRIVAQLEVALGDGNVDVRSLSVAPTEHEHEHEHSEHDHAPRDRSGSTRPSMSYDSQRVDLSDSATTPTGTIPIQPPQPATAATFKNLTGADMRDSLPVSTTGGLNSRVVSCATFGERDPDAKLSLTLPKSIMVRSHSNRSDSTTGTRSAVGGTDVRPPPVQRLSTATSAGGWESSPTLPKKVGGAGSGAALPAVPV